MSIFGGKSHKSVIPTGLPVSTETGDTPVSSMKGDIPAKDSPNVTPQTIKTPWLYPMVVSVPANSHLDVSIPIVPERIAITQVDSGNAAFAFAPGGGGVNIPMTQSAELRLPGQNRDFSLVNSTASPIRFVIIGMSGYSSDSYPELSYPSSGGGAGGNVVITGPLDGSGNVKIALEASAVPQQVDGTAAVGAVPVGNPVYIAGFDGTHVQNLLTDTSGHQIVNINNTVTVIGAAAAGAVPSGDPVLIAGYDGTHVQYIATDTSGHQIININTGQTITAVGAAAAGAIPSGDPVLIAGYDGTHVQYIATDTSGHQIVNINTGQSITANPPTPTPTAGQVTVGTSAVQLSASSLPLTSGSLVVKAPATNTGVVYVGFSSGVTTGNGFPLEAGASVPIDLSNVDAVWVIASVAAQTASWIGS